MPIAEYQLECLLKWHKFLQGKTWKVHFKIGDPVAAHARAVEFERFSIYAGHDLKTDLNCRRVDTAYNCSEL